MLPQILENNRNIIISTGNILNIIKKTGQKPTEELYDCLQATLKEPIYTAEHNQINRSKDDLNEKIAEHERIMEKIGAKIFLNTNSVEYLNEAVTALLRILNLESLDNLILAYHPVQQLINGRDLTHLNGDEDPKPDGVLKWGGKSAQTLSDLKFLWKNLEQYAEKKMITQLGISDLDSETLSELYDACTVHPTIAQINLSACCVVPPPLQEFCTKNEIQLLTHSDPEVIISNESLHSLGLKGYQPTWTVRYQVHVKCRGLLTAKGFLVGLKR